MNLKTLLLCTPMLATLLCAKGGGPAWNFQFAAAETIAITSQAYTNGGLIPSLAAEGAFTNYLRRYDGVLSAQMGLSLFRASVGIRGTFVLKEYYDATGNGIPQSNVAAVDLGIWPEVGLRLWKFLYVGMGFNWTPMGTNGALSATESWDRTGANAVTLRTAADIRVFQSPLWLSLGVGGSVPLGGEANRLWVDGALRLDITYYISTELRYRAFFLGSRSPHDFYIGFQYRFTPAWSASAHWSRMLYSEARNPQNRVGAALAFSTQPGEI